ncbi:MAG: DUF4380 domain-containing protein [Proteobacteria bacterium]|nr:DUF4380 domain-containing protein [Pseudomonadota bacterium]
MKKYGWILLCVLVSAMACESDDESNGNLYNNANNATNGVDTNGTPGPSTDTDGLDPNADTNTPTDDSMDTMTQGTDTTPHAGTDTPGTDIQGTDTPDTGAQDTYTWTGPIERNVVVDGSTVPGFALEFGNGTDTWRFEFTAQKGALISGFYLNGHNILHNSTANGTLGGSTFWPSPQSIWNWPPLAELDSHTWSAAVDEANLVVTLTSPVIGSLSMQVEKRFALDLNAGAISLTYTIHNTGSQSRTVAPWEITRVAPNGLTFYPTGEGVPSSGSFSPIPYSNSLGTTWIDHRDVTGEHKLLADGAEGWLAHSDGTVLLLKTFPDIPLAQAAPGEGEIEVYAKTTYAEVEQQGVYETLAAGASSVWQVKWQLRALPATVVNEAGSATLLNFVDSLL